MKVSTAEQVMFFFAQSVLCEKIVFTTTISAKNDLHVYRYWFLQIKFFQFLSRTTRALCNMFISILLILWNEISVCKII